MAISVGDYAFDEKVTTVRETLETVGGRETRSIVLSGLLRGTGDAAALDEALDEILRATSADSPVYVSVRPGRRMLTRREQFVREVHRGGQAGRFELSLRAEQAWEESAAATSIPWSILMSGGTVTAENSGTLETPAVLTFEALGTIWSPRVSDGARALGYDGIFEAGSIWVVDGEAGRVLLDGVDITPYTTGEFPLLAPGETTLTYSDDPSSSHSLSGTLSFRNRWW